MVKHSELNLGQIEAVANKLGGMDGIRRLLADELMVVERVGNPHLRLLTRDLTLDPTDGKQTIAQAADVFTGWIDGDFRNYGCDVVGKPTEATKVTVHEVVKDGTYRQIFGSLSDNLDELCLEQDQIIQFAKKHRDQLRADGYGTFFLFKVNGAFFVAVVGWHVGRELEVDVLRLADDYVWRAGRRHHVVVPQLAP